MGMKQMQNIPLIRFETKSTKKLNPFQFSHGMFNKSKVSEVF